MWSAATLDSEKHACALWCGDAWEDACAVSGVVKLVEGWWQCLCGVVVVVVCGR